MNPIHAQVKRAEGKIKEINKYTLQIYIVIGFLGFGKLTISNLHIYPRINMFTLVRLFYILFYQEGRILVVPAGKSDSQNLSKVEKLTLFICF